MSKRLFSLCLGLSGSIAVSVLIGVTGFSQPGPTPIEERSAQSPAPWAASSVEALDSGLYRIGSVLVDRKNNTISIPGAINMRDGAIEYLAVTPYGKTYESVLTLKAKPLHIQLALLLLGAEYGGGLAFQGDTALPAGDSVDMYVSWVNEKKETKRVPACDFLYDREAKRAMPLAKWVFTGSMLADSARFAADIEGSIIAVYSDPVAVINNPHRGRFDQTMYHPNTDVLPPLGTEITMTIVVPKR